MADIRSFTTISESLPHQQVVKILNNYLGVMADVMAHDGTVDEFIGDAILALFGAPVSKSDDSERAIAVLLKCRHKSRALIKLMSQGLPSISMGIGINTGEVTGNIDHKACKIWGCWAYS